MTSSLVVPEAAFRRLLHPEVVEQWIRDPSRNFVVRLGVEEGRILIRERRRSYAPLLYGRMYPPDPMKRLLIATCLMSASTLANESSFSFKMEHRYVNGKDNGVEHDMDKGSLSISGELWASSCAVLDEEKGERAKP